MTDQPTPTGTARPRDTLADHAEARQQLADSQQTVTPEAVEARTAVNRLGRLEERADRADGRMTTIESKLDHNTRATSRGALWAQFAAVGGPILLAILSALGQWGEAHPEAKVGLVGLFLTIAGALGRVKVPAAAAATPAAPDPTPPAHS